MAPDQAACRQRRRTLYRPWAVAGGMKAVQRGRRRILQTPGLIHVELRAAGETTTAAAALTRLWPASTNWHRDGPSVGTESSSTWWSIPLGAGRQLIAVP